LIVKKTQINLILNKQTFALYILKHGMHEITLLYLSKYSLVAL